MKVGHDHRRVERKLDPSVLYDAFFRLYTEGSLFFKKVVTLSPHSIRICLF
jgi:hypothetical protein